MRVRTIVTFAAGTAAGAGVMYLLDPDAGEARRREFRRDALHQAKDGVVAAGKGGAQLASELTQAAVEGYRQGRADADPEVPAT
ncbi:MAG: hypothetical protein EA340_06665 [Nitriliruptor sp.]|nr:MAG: hypothetical protein EA340_06665 [Nitriliruptor sp.]